MATMSKLLCKIGLHHHELAIRTKDDSVWMVEHCTRCLEDHHWQLVIRHATDRTLRWAKQTDPQQWWLR